MRIAEVNLYRYELPFEMPLVLGGFRQDVRTGILIQLVSDEGREGWGEAAPLPRFSRESVEEVLVQLTAIRSTLVGERVSAEPDDREGHFPPVLLAADTAPSARFALESAWWDLQDRDEADGSGERYVPVNGLLTGDAGEVRARAVALARQGYRTLKLKVGRETPERDAELVLEVWEACGGRMALRLDANRAWPYEQAMDFLRRVSEVPFEYIEEPLSDASRLHELALETGARIALDESLLEGSPEALDGYSFASAVVLKPTLLGGLSPAVAYAGHARALGMTPVVSAAFESGIGIRALALLAARIAPGTAAGLDTYNWLAEDVLAPRLSMHGGRLDTAELLERPRIRPDMLQRIA